MDFEMIEMFKTHIMPHWPFLSAMVVFMLVGRVMTKNVFTKTAHHNKGKWTWLFWWGRKTLALHPIMAGAVLGMLWREPEPGMKDMAASVMYFAMSGALSVWAYETLKGIAKKHGIDLTVPGVDSVPPQG
jgi:hypothetical protein